MKELVIYFIIILIASFVHINGATNVLEQNAFDDNAIMAASIKSFYCFIISKILVLIFTIIAIIKAKEKYLRGFFDNILLPIILGIALFMAMLIGLRQFGSIYGMALLVILQNFFFACCIAIVCRFLKFIKDIIKKAF